MKPSTSRRPAPLKVLCIEDDCSSLSLIERTVGAHDHVVLLVARDGVRGTEMAREHRPDLVLTALDVAGIGGEEVLARLRVDPCTRSVPVIVSGQAPATAEERLIGRGAQCYLPKPIDAAELARAIEDRAEVRDAA